MSAHRATGTDAGSFLLVPPGWNGDAPDDATVIRLPTAVASIVGRFAVAGERRPAGRRRAAGGPDTDPGRRPRRGPPGRRSRRGGRPRLLRAAARGDGGLPARRPRRAAAGALPGDRPSRAGVPLRGSRPGAGRGAPRRPRGEPGAHGGRPPAGREPVRQRLEAHLPPVRLQPRLLRGRRPRRSGLEDHRSQDPVHPARPRRAGRAVGQPRLRGRLRHDVRGRRRRRR